MKRLFRVLRWLLGVFAVAVLALLLLHLTLRPNSDAANTEQYAVLSAYIEPGLTYYSHDLGCDQGLVVVAARTTFFPDNGQLKQIQAIHVSGFKHWPC
jgi:hypothetical protein